MPFQYVAPGSFKGIHIEITLHATTYLDEVSPGLRMAQTLKEHRALHWREGIDVLDVTATSAQLFQFRPAEFCERKICWFITARFTRTAMLDQQTQRFDITLRQLFDRLELLQVLTVDPGQPEPACGDMCVDVDDVRAQRAWAAV